MWLTLESGAVHDTTNHSHMKHCQIRLLSSWHRVWLTQAAALWVAAGQLRAEKSRRTPLLASKNKARWMVFRHLSNLFYNPSASRRGTSTASTAGPVECTITRSELGLGGIPIITKAHVGYGCMVISCSSFCGHISNYAELVWQAFLFITLCSLW